MIAAGLVLPTLVSRAARHLAGRGYQSVTNRKVPLNPAHPSVSLRRALVWSATAGAVGGLASMVTRRALAPTDIPAEGFDMPENLDES